MKHNKTKPAVEPARALLPREATPPPRILVVDDDVAVRQLSAEILMRSGYEVEAAADGAAAWQALNTDTYDLLITDHNVPDLTGVELLKKLRAARMALPVIIAAGALPKEEATPEPWLKPAATLRKPYTVDELLGTVREVLRATENPR